MRKGRFTKSEIQSAVASNCLGLEAFFSLILGIFINGGASTKTNKKNQFKYFSYEDISFVNGAGLSYLKTDSSINQNIKIINNYLNIDIENIVYPNKKSLFFHMALSFIALLKDISINDLEGFISSIDICLDSNKLNFANIEYDYIKALQKNSGTTDKKKTIENYIQIYYNCLIECFKEEDGSSSDRLQKDAIQHIKKIIKIICNKIDNRETDDLRLEKSLFDISNYYFDVPKYVFFYADEKLSVNPFLLTTKLQILNINMPKHNGRTLLLKMFESVIDTLNLDLKYDFNKSILKELDKNPQKKYYAVFFDILYQNGLIGKNSHFTLNPEFKKYFENYFIEYKNKDEQTDNASKGTISDSEEEKFFKKLSNQVVYIPVIIEITKENHTALPIEICLQAIHYLYKISFLNAATYKCALEDIIVLYNREIYLNNDSRINSKNYIKSQARKRDKILSDILHKYLGFLDITIIAMLDEINDFNEYDKEKLEKELRINELMGIKLFIVKFQDVGGHQVKFSLEDYVSLKDELGENSNPVFFDYENVDFCNQTSFNSHQNQILKDMGNREYRSLHSVENYVYGKSIFLTLETIPIITKYEINEFYEDLLNIKQVVADIYNIINTNQKTSFYGGYSIGVLGNFGAGKSSIINLLFSLLYNKEVDETEDVYKERTYKITLSDYSSESIVEEVFLQLEKSILQEQMKFSSRKKRKKITLLINHLKFWNWKKQKKYLKNLYYSKKIIEDNLIQNLAISQLEKKRINKELMTFAPNSKVGFFKFLKELEFNAKGYLRTLEKDIKEEFKNHCHNQKKDWMTEQKKKIKNEKKLFKKCILFLQSLSSRELKKQNRKNRDVFYLDRAKRNLISESGNNSQTEFQRIYEEVMSYKPNSKGDFFKFLKKLRFNAKDYLKTLKKDTKEEINNYCHNQKTAWKAEQKKKIKNEKKSFRKCILFLQFICPWERKKRNRKNQNTFYSDIIKEEKLIEKLYSQTEDQKSFEKRINQCLTCNSKSIFKCFKIRESFIKRICDDLKSSLKEQVKKYLKQGKKQFFIEQRYYTKKISEKQKNKKNKRLKKKIDSYIFSNHGISSTKEIEDHTELRRKKHSFTFWGIIFVIISIALWIIFIILYFYYAPKDKFNDSPFKENLFNLVPLLATLPSLFTSYFIYQGVRGRQTTALAENKIAVYHIERLLVFSKELLYKRSNFYKNYKKYDEKLSTYPLNTIIMIDNLDRISNERVGNVLQGISFINNEIENSNITFIIPISYEKFFENTLFLNERYSVKGEEVQFTFKNPDLDMPIVINNAYLNKVFDYKIFLPNLNKEKFGNFIHYALNKAIDRRFIELDSIYLEKLVNFLKKYFDERGTRNLRDIANVLNSLFSYIPTINCIELSYQQKYFAILLMLVFCDIRYRFIEAIEELILSNKFFDHLKDNLIGTEQKKFYDYYSEFFKFKFNNSYEGEKYEMHFKSIVKLLKNEAKKVVFAFEKEFIEKVWKIFKTNDSFPSDWRMDK